MLVILDTEAIPANYDEKLANRLKVRESIFTLSLEIPIDLVVYSRSEYKNLLAADSPFIREIERSGKVLYEKAG